jgi:hypothetical protein
VKYSIISEKKVPNIKRSLEVRLNKKVSTEVLETIAYKLMQLDKSRYPRTFIAYYLPDMEVGAGAWATTHFTPNIEVKILGATAEEEARLKSPPANPKDNILGDWYCNQPFLESRTSLYIKDNRIYLKNVFKDGSSGVDEMIEKKSAMGRRFEEKEVNPNGEYYLINTNGLLEIWSQNGKIVTCNKMGK